MGPSTGENSVQTTLPVAAGDEQRIMEKAAGNPAEFGPLYERYFERIFYYCYRRVGQPEEAEDLSARIFSNALANLASYRGGSVAAWLFQIAHNAVANHLRGRRPSISLEQTGVLEVPGEAITTLEQLVRREKLEQVRDLIEALTDEQKDLLALSVTGELNSKEIGQIVGKSDTAVRMQLHRIIKQLREGFLKVEAAEEDLS